MTKKIGLLSFLGKFGKDEDGHILIYFTLMLPVLVGMIGLVLDGGRFFHLNTDLHELADAAAVAGAAELDGRSDAIDRATDRARNLLSNDPRWSNVALSGVQITTPTFYSSISPSGDTVTTDSTLANYIKVTTVNRQVQPIFVPLAAAMRGFGATPNAQTSASAVAGSGSVACNVQPLMLCNPLEGTSDFTATAGQLFLFKDKGSTGGFSPGDFGLVDPPGVNSGGAKTIRNLLSQQSPNFCYVNEISPRPGQVTGDVADAINVRFDITPNGNTSGMNQTPAPNVIKGIMTDPTKPQDACSFNGNKYKLDSASTLPRPPSAPSPSNTTYTFNAAQFPGATDMVAIGSSKVGNTMDLTAANAYWNYHHGSNWPTGWTRFRAYCRELGLGDNCLGSSSPPAWVAGTEPNAPQCAPAAVRNSGDYKRRLLAVAVVNCQANNVQGNSPTNLRSNSYALFFLTKPSPTNQPGALDEGGPSHGTITAEFVEMITPAACAANPTNPFCSGLHQIVQLYR